MSEENHFYMDSKTPYNVQLTAFYKRSFAFYTVKERMPVILTHVIDNLVRNKEEITAQYGEFSREEIKTVIGEISKLKYEIQTNKSITQLTSSEPDIPIYNKYLLERSAQDGHPTYFSTVWLYSECYMYRRLRDIFALTNSLKNYDPFRSQKQQAFWSSVNAMSILSDHLLKVLNTENTHEEKNEFINLLKLNLWGNKCDLSLSLGVEKSQKDDPISVLQSLEKYILADETEKIWGAISDRSRGIVDIVFDNSGYEVFADFCLADFILSKRLATQIRFYVKLVPWFISDVMPQDFFWTLNTLSNHEDENLAKVGARWLKYVEKGDWVLQKEYFWTLPYDFSRMKFDDEALYSKLSEAKLIFFKGDLNYRKLLGEVNWDPTTPFNRALQGFHPSKLCTLRTIKADIICGLKKGVADKLDKEVPNWMTSGEYGVIQFSDRCC